MFVVFAGKKLSPWFDDNKCLPYGAVSNKDIKREKHTSVRLASLIFSFSVSSAQRSRLI